MVLRRYGNTAEIFGGDPSRGLWRGLLAGSWAMSTTAVREFGELGRQWSVGLRVISVVGLVLLIAWPVRRWRRRFSRLRRVDRIGDVPTGTSVRIAGTIEAEGKLARAPGTDREAVFVRTQFWPTDGRDRPGPFACEEIRGNAFRVRLSDGVSVRLMPSDVILTDGPRRVSGVSRTVLQELGAALRGRCLQEAPFCEDVLAPGDRIEAVGRLVTEVSAAGDGAPVRGVPLVHSLRPLERGGVMVRRWSARA